MLRLRRQQAIERKLGESIHKLLHRLYHQEQYTTREICKKLSISIHTLLAWMNDLDISLRTPSEAVTLQYVRKPERRELARQLAKKHLVPLRPWFEDKGSERYAEICESIRQAKLKDNWMRGRVGRLHHGWRGGKIWWRGKEWNDLKLKIRERDDFCCQHCSMTEERHLERHGQPLQVHHKVPYRMTQDNSPNNLITLCASCHTKIDAQVDLPLFEPTLQQLEPTSTGISGEREFPARQ